MNSRLLKLEIIYFSYFFQEVLVIIPISANGHDFIRIIYQHLLMCIRRNGYQGGKWSQCAEFKSRPDPLG